MEVKELYRYFLDSAGVATDSRVASPGKIFFALRGDKFDGHAFVPQALEGGCSKAVIDNDGYRVSGRTILVDNVLDSLQQLARHHRKQFNIPVIAITGSNGKTTTKELIKAVLSARFATLATRGNLNNHIGVPLTLLELDSSHQKAVIEIGANHIGEIAMLCETALPTHGLITNIGPAHLEGFGSPEGVRKAKSELFVYLKKTGGTAFLNSDRPNLRELVDELGMDQISFGMAEECFISGRIISPVGLLELEFSIRETGQTTPLKTRLAGAYNFENILAAVCTGVYFGVSSAEIKDAVENYIPRDNRSQISETSQNRLLLDAYNANPESMQAALVNFFSMPGENKSVILGDMLELGDYAAAEHEKIINLLKQQRYREVILVGDLFCSSPAPCDFIRFRDVDDLKVWLKANPLHDRFILLKGSRGIQLERCIALL